MIFFFPLMIQAGSLSDSKNDPQELKAFHCPKEQKELFNNWNDVNRKWIAHPKDDGSLIYFKPTSEMSVWIGFEKRKDQVVFTRMSPQSVYEVSFDKGCKKELKVLKNEIVDYKKIPDHFVTDPKLFSIISQYKTGIIYHFSPKMNLSIEGVKTIISLSNRLKIPALILMDQNAASEIPNVVKIFKEQNVNIGEIFLSHSFEMYMRRSYIHYPNLILFKNGAIVDEFFPGLSSEADYESMIKARI